MTEVEESKSFRSTFTSTTGETFQIVKTKFNPNDSVFEDAGFAENDFLTKLNIDGYVTLTEAESVEFLEKVDALELFTSVQGITQEFANVQLENYFLVDFLTKNDPKLLVGLQNRRSTALKARKNTTSSINLRQSQKRQSVMSARRSFASSQYGFRKVPIEYQLNYRAKAEMAEKTATVVEKRITDLEANSTRQLKLLHARIEELRYRCEEAQETERNFQLHFQSDPLALKFLDKATEEQLERKFHKFVNNWYKNARALLATMRLRITALTESCQQHRNDLIVKSGLSGILGAVDFEQLMIKRTELLNSLEEKNSHMAGLKDVTSKASLALSEQKTIMMAIEDESKQVTNKTIETIKQIGKLEKEANLVEKENEKDIKLLNFLKVQLATYEAPSVNDYIVKKDELVILEKEEKMLRRKTYILNMKLNNLINKIKRQF